MKPKEAFGRYGCVPREMHPAWQRVSYYARAIGKDLIGRIDDFDSMRLETSGDWKSSLCLTLAINGSERRNAKGALDALVDAGLLSPGDGFVTVNLQPVCSHSVSVSAVTLQSVGVRKGPVVDSVSSQVPENNQVTSDSKQAIKASERVTREHARESSARFEKPPLPPPPPNLSPSELTPIRPESRCWQLYQRALGTEHLLLPPNHHDALQALASAAKAEADGATHGEAFDRAAERILGVWMAEKYWQEKRPGLRNLKERLEEGKYARKKPLFKAVDKHWTDAELLALSSHEEFILEQYDKERRWKLVLAKERREDEAAARAAAGVAS